MICCVLLLFKCTLPLSLSLGASSALALPGLQMLCLQSWTDWPVMTVLGTAVAGQGACCQGQGCSCGGHVERLVRCQ